MNSTTSDDCLATMQAFSNQFLEHQINPGLALANNDYFSSHFLSEFCRILEFPIDYSADAQHGAILQNQYIQRLLSAQTALGYAGDYSLRPHAARLAHTILNMKYLATNLATLLRGKPAESELRNPGMTYSHIAKRQSYVSKCLNWFRIGPSSCGHGKLVNGPHNLHYR